MKELHRTEMACGDGMTEKKLKGRELRGRVLAALKLEDSRRALAVLAELPARQVVNPLFALFCSNDSTVRWRAVTAMGAMVAELAAVDMEAARVVMRRMIWQLNEESGGIGWGIPEAMGETMARHEGLAREYAHMLVSYIQEDGNFLEHVPLQRGVLWGLGRLAQARLALVAKAVPHVQSFLSAEDAQLRGLAVWFTGLVRVEAARHQLEGLSADCAEIPLYVGWREYRYTVRELAREAMAALNGTPS